MAYSVIEDVCHMYSFVFTSIAVAYFPLSSVLPSSIRIISMSDNVCAKTLSMHLGRSRSVLYIGMMTDMSGILYTFVSLYIKSFFKRRRV